MIKMALKREQLFLLLQEKGHTKRLTRDFIRAKTKVDQDLAVKMKEKRQIFLNVTQEQMELALLTLCIYIHRNVERSQELCPMVARLHLHFSVSILNLKKRISEQKNRNIFEFHQTYGDDDFVLFCFKMDSLILQSLNTGVVLKCKPSTLYL